MRIRLSVQPRRILRQLGDKAVLKVHQRRTTLASSHGLPSKAAAPERLILTLSGPIHVRLAEQPVHGVLRIPNGGLCRFVCPHGRRGLFARWPYKNLTVAGLACCRLDDKLMDSMY